MSFSAGSGTADVPGSAPGSNLTIQRWSRRIEPGLYDRMKFIPNIAEDEDGPIYNTLNIRRLGRAPSQQLAATDDGTGVTFSTLSPANITLTPVWVVVAAAIPDSLLRRGGEEIDPAYADNVETALSAALDNLRLGDVATAINTFGGPGYNIDGPGLKSQLANVATASHGTLMPGEDINILLDTGQIGAALSIPEVNNAYQRGDGRSPLVTGVLSTGFGYRFMFTTLLAFDANGHHSPLWAKNAYRYGYNKRPGVERQRYLKQRRIMADAEIGGTIVYNERTIDIRTQ